MWLQVAHASRIAVGGHSYGAFMTANLLAHAPHLFCCGIARAGAYNRTLTPFGFQVSIKSIMSFFFIIIKPANDLLLSIMSQYFDVLIVQLSAAFFFHDGLVCSVCF